MDLIHDTYGGEQRSPESLNHSKAHLGAHQGGSTPFHHKEEVAIKSFNARIIALFLHELPDTVRDGGTKQIESWFKGEDIRRADTIARVAEARLRFLDVLYSIQKAVFPFDERASSPSPSAPVDEVFRNHVRFLQDMELYLSLKFAIKYADLGLIERAIVRCCLVFAGSGHTNYANLSLYLTRLLATDAADPPLKRALLSGMLVNCRGVEDGWFEVDRLNEHHNLSLKILLQGRKRSSADTTALFTRVSLTASYSLDLREHVEAAFGVHVNNRHQMKKADLDVLNLARELFTTLKKVPHGRRSFFATRDIVSDGHRKLTGGEKEKEVDTPPSMSQSSKSKSSKSKPSNPNAPKSRYHSLIDAFNKTLGRAYNGGDLGDDSDKASGSVPISVILESVSVDDI